MPEAPTRLLIIRLSSIGDIVHALPAVAALAATYPQAEIHWAIEARYAGLLQDNDTVHRVLPLDTLGWRKRLAARATMASIHQSLTALRETSYDAAIDFQGLYKSALIAKLSRARERVGFSDSRLREPAAAVLYTTKVTPPPRAHVIEMNLALVERLGVPRLARTQWRFPLPASAADRDYVDRQLVAGGISDFIILNPGGGWKSKCWAPENYAALIRQLADEFAGNFLLTGSPDEVPIIEAILQDCKVARASYFRSTILQFIELARRAKLLVGGDTGPLHLAAAVGTPIAGIYGPTDPVRNGPFAPDDITLWNQGRIDYTRRAKHAGFIEGISVGSVVAAVRTRLQRAHA